MPSPQARRARLERLCALLTDLCVALRGGPRFRWRSAAAVDALRPLGVELVTPDSLGVRRHQLKRGARSIGVYVCGKAELKLYVLGLHTVPRAPASR